MRGSLPLLKNIWEGDKRKKVLFCLWDCSSVLVNWHCFSHPVTLRSDITYILGVGRQKDLLSGRVLAGGRNHTSYVRVNNCSLGVDVNQVTERVKRKVARYYI